MKDVTTMAATTTAVLALIVLIGLATPVYSRLGQLEAEVRHSRERADAQHQETLEELRRLTEVIGSHYHTPEGEVVFTIPPRAARQPGHSHPGAAVMPPSAPGGFPLSRE